MNQKQNKQSSPAFGGGSREHVATTSSKFNSGRKQQTEDRQSESSQSQSATGSKYQTGSESYYYSSYYSDSKDANYQTADQGVRVLPSKNMKQISESKEEAEESSKKNEDSKKLGERRKTKGGYTQSSYYTSDYDTEQSDSRT